MMEMHTAHLDTTDSGLLYVRRLPDATLFDTLDCGFLACPHWPAELGEEPDWFGPELDQLRERVEVETEAIHREARHEQSMRQQEYIANCVGDLR